MTQNNADKTVKHSSKIKKKDNLIKKSIADLVMRLNP